MGLDLTILPIEADHGEWGFAHSMLEVERRSALFEAMLEALKEHPVPPDFRTHLLRGEDGESRYGNTQETPYGEPLGWVRAEELLAFAEHEGVTNNAQNRAAWAYLGALGPGSKVALYWH